MQFVTVAVGTPGGRLSASRVGAQNRPALDAGQAGRFCRKAT